MTDSDADLQAAISVVCQFTSEMNAWENRMYYRSRIENDEFVSDSAAEALAGTTYEGVLGEYHPIFAKHCTSRTRKYGGAPNGWSKGGSYAGIEPSTILSAERVKPSRIEVVAAGGLFPDSQFLFVLHRKGDAWLIDSAKWRAGDSGEWDTHHL